MRLKERFIIAAAAAAMIPGSVLARDGETRELNRINAKDDGSEYVSRKAPSHASYKTQLVGFVYYADSWNRLPDGQATPMGIYTIDTKPGSMPEPFARIGYMNSHCSGGAVLAGDTFYYIWRQTDPTGMTSIDISQLFTYNVVTGEFKNLGEVSSALASTNDHAWDPTDGTIYGQYSIDGKRKLAKVDYLHGGITPVGDCGNYYGLAVDAEGQMYGIDNVGDLYKVDKTTGSAVKVGPTGVNPNPRYSQSMTFDVKTNEMYWAYMGDAGNNLTYSRLYKVDPKTGAATLVTTFDDQQEIFGLGVMPALAKDNAPGYVTDIKVEMQGAATDGRISFVLPLYTYMGENLTGEISWTVYANDNKVAEGKGQKGSRVSQAVTLPNGDVTVSVVCSNAEGEGPAASFSQWVGEDYPLAPDNVTLSVDEKTGRFSLSWDAVTAGQHGGYVDPAKITYTVTRFPDKKEVAKETKAVTFEETLAEPDIPVGYHYEIKAINGFRESEVAKSNTIPFGKGFQVPYFQHFDNEASMNLFFAIDGNNDSSTWKWSNHKTKTAYIFTGTDNPEPQDDWLITPGIDMKAGNRYELRYTVCQNMNNGKFFDKMEVQYGLGVAPKDYKMAEESFVSLGKQVKHRVVVTPDKDGYYHFGFHAISGCTTGLSIEIDDISVDVLPNEQAPAKVENLTIKTSQGTAPVTFRFNLPKKRVNGKALDKLTKVEIWRNTSELVKSQEVSEPGKLITMTDSKGAKGLTMYSIVAYNEAGIGERLEQEVYLGLDLPGAPGNILLTDNLNGGVKLTWETPKEGAHGGYCDPNNLTYNIYKVVNGSAVGFKEGVKGNELMIDVQEGYYAQTQSIVIYAVQPVNSAGGGGAYVSTEVVVGNPYTYPFAESWVNGNARWDMWYRMNNGADGWLPEANHSSDNDGGCMAFDAAKDGDLSYVCFGKVNMLNAMNPKLMFGYYALPGEDMYLIPEVNLAYSGEFAQADMINFHTLSGEAGWREAVVDLNGFKHLPYIAIRLLGKGSALHPLRIDNLRIMDSDKTPTQGFGSVGQIYVDNALVKYYDLNGLEVSNPQKGGIYILRSSDGKTRKVIL